MDYKKYTREQLLGRIDELEKLNQELLREKEQETRLEYAWTGNLGHWYWNIKTNSVTFDPLKVTTLGYKMDELPDVVTYQFFTDKLHPDDYQKTMDAMLDHLHGKKGVYEAEYRIMAKDGSYRWYLDRGRITQYDAEGKPSFLAGIVFEITEKKEMEIELAEKNKILAELSSVDGLTKIANHRTLMERLKYEMENAGKTGRPLSVALFDIDNFKNINDSRGHIFGDKVLKGLAVIIKENIRETDFAGRYGGEEFFVIFPETDGAKAVNISERIRQAVESYDFTYGSPVTVSGGVRQYGGEELADLVHLADENMYKAKKMGKNRIIS